MFKRTALSFPFLAAILIFSFFASSSFAFAAKSPDVVGPPPPGGGCGSVHWHIDNEQYIAHQGTNLAGQSVTYYWDLSLSSLQDQYGAYCGRVAEKACLTVPAYVGWPQIKIENEWYINGNYVNSSKTLIYPPNSYAKQYCTYSGSFLMAYHNTASVDAYMLTPSGNAYAGFPYAIDRVG
jgi:hypothetical protein